VEVNENDSQILSTILPVTSEHCPRKEFFPRRQSPISCLHSTKKKIAPVCPILGHVRSLNQCNSPINRSKSSEFESMRRGKCDTCIAIKFGKTGRVCIVESENLSLQISFSSASSMSVNIVLVHARKSTLHKKGIVCTPTFPRQSFALQTAVARPRIFKNHATHVSECPILENEGVTARFFCLTSRRE
jgi:hypothetical protein